MLLIAKNFLVTIIIIKNTFSVENTILFIIHNFIMKIVILIRIIILKIFLM